jgi:hypothetical protein
MFSFSARKKSADSQRHIRRLVNLTIPNRAGPNCVDRCENRHNRSIPILLCPWEQNKPILSQAILAVSKDFGDRGVGIILRRGFDAEVAVVGFCHQEATGNEPWFFLGVRRTNVPIGGGFWLLGIELTEFLDEIWHVELEPLFPIARMLLPPSPPVEPASAQGACGVGST